MTENQFDKNAQLFLGLISSLSSQAYMQMGKLKNPITDKIERDLSSAALSIDMLAMLQSKTEGNLSDDESKFVDHTLHELRMNFVAEQDKPEASPEPAESEEETQEESGNEEK